MVGATSHQLQRVSGPLELGPKSPKGLKKVSKSLCGPRLLVGALDFSGLFWHSGLVGSTFLRLFRDLGPEGPDH